MKPHPDLQQQIADRLRNTVQETPAATAEPPTAPDTGPPQARGFKSYLKKFIRRAISWYVDDASERAASVVEDRVGQRIGSMEERLVKWGEAEVLTINLELLKGEVRALVAGLERVEGMMADVGMAIAPGAGIVAAQERLAEQRERLNAVERRMRRVEARGTAAPSTANSEHVELHPEPELVRSTQIDYVGFEQRFRGEPERVSAAAIERYLDRLRGHAPVVDVGCGKGELLAILAREGIEAVGVEIDPGMISEAAERGLSIVQQDAVAYLRDQTEHSLGAVVAIHVLEHLELGYLVEFLELSATKLRPGGLLIAETPNPASLVVLGNSYVLDPTHVRPLHPSLLTFLCESAGFRDVRLEFFEPATSYHLPRVEADGAPEWVQTINHAFEKLNEVLFGPQEYAVLATTPKL